jgi:hypothetical protein
VSIGDGQRWWLRIHGSLDKRLQLPFPQRFLIASNAV